MISQEDIKDLCPEEIWKPIPEWEEMYEASSLGRIRSCVRILEVFGKNGWYKRPYGGYLLSPKKQIISGLIFFSLNKRGISIVKYANCS